MTGLAGRAASALSWSTLEMGGRQLVTLAVFVLLARLLGPEVMGLVALAMILIGIAERVVHEGLVEGLVQRVAIETGHIDASFWALLVLSLVLTGAALGLAWPAAALFGQPGLVPLIIGAASIIPLTAIASVPSVLLRRELAFKVLAIRTTAGVAVGGVVGVGLALGGAGAWALIGQQVASRLIMALVVWFGVAWRPGFRATGRHFRELWGFGAQMLALRLFSVIEQRTANFIIGLFLGPTALGLYGLAARCLAIATEVLIQPGGRVAFSLFARLQTDPKALAQAAALSITAATALAAPALLGAALVADPLIHVVFGPQWQAAVLPFIILMLGGLALPPITVISALLRGVGRPMALTLFTLLSLVLTAIGLIIATQFGIAAAAGVIALFTILSLPIYALLAKRHAGIGLAGGARAILPVLPALLVMGAAVLAWRIGIRGMLAPWQELLGAMAIGVTCYLGWYASFGRSNLHRMLDLWRGLTLKDPGREGS